ncbi:MAG: aminotransferase class III-fold pyridoxal phosphate-dependent enzyme [Ignavibacteria bacterium]|nr:aminotransferase class III-fold pyridoxal phosphate-dependent enzyme [Ignavibacteria bacterium]
MANKLSLNNDYPVIDESLKLLNRAEGLIPSYTQTLAKGPSQYVRGVCPVYLVKGKGSHVWDADGNEYIDYGMGIGPLVLGYCFSEVDEAVRKQLDEGITFSLMHPLEVEVSGMIRDNIPNAECVRFSKTGADVTSAAVRLARAYTGKNKILCCGYHGWHDWYISVTTRNKGVPLNVADLTYTFQYNDIDSLKNSLDDDVACIILEPVTFYEPEYNFLHTIREICDKNNIVLIFDEMWTGFRINPGGAQKYFGVNADLACFSKAVANGMPLSVLTGRKEIMQLLDEDVFFYTTFGGDALSLAAAKATIKCINEKGVTDYLSTTGFELKEGLNELLRELDIDYIRCEGYGFRTTLSFSHPNIDSLLIKSLLQQELIKRGILWNGFHNISYSHTQSDIDYTLEAYEHSLKIINKAVGEADLQKYLRGEPVKPVFRKSSDFNTKPRKVV